MISISLGHYNFDPGDLEESASISVAIKSCSAVMIHLTEVSGEHQLLVLPSE